MNRDAYRDEIRFRLTGGLLDLEIDDKAIDMCIDASFREVQRYIDSTKIVTVPYEKCIDLSGAKVSSVTEVYRAESLGGINAGDDKATDPMVVAQWQMNSGIGMANIANYVANYSAWTTLYQMRNTMATDLDSYYDKSKEKLYITSSTGSPKYITIEYIPRFDDVADVVSDYWIDIIMRMAVANAKIIVGRIRTRFTQTGALWAQDGERILEEGTNELNELRTYLQTNYNNLLPLD